MKITFVPQKYYANTAFRIERHSYESVLTRNKPSFLSTVPGEEILSSFKR